MSDKDICWLICALKNKKTLKNLVILCVAGRGQMYDRGGAMYGQVPGYGQQPVAAPPPQQVPYGRGE